MDNDPRPAAWRVKVDGPCSRCGIELHAGEVAAYERATRTMHCIECPAAPAIDIGIAGRSAHQTHDRLVAGREERIKARLGNRLGGFVLAVTDEPQSTRAWARGARGEEKLAEALGGFSMLHDRRVPRSRANIDHIVIAPAGVFVIDAKLYKGLIRIRDRGSFFRPDNRLFVGSHDCSALADGMAWQVAAVDAALRGAGIDPLPPIVPVLCFVDGEWPLFSPPSEFRGVRLESPKSIRKILAAPTVLDEATVDRLTAVIALALPPL
jgi:hypothetical protein